MEITGLKSGGGLVRSSMDYANSITFGEPTKEVARIGPDGIMRFTVEANDENAARFVECIELYIGRRLTGVSVSEAGWSEHTRKGNDGLVSRY